METDTTGDTNSFTGIRDTRVHRSTAATNRKPTTGWLLRFLTITSWAGCSIVETMRCNSTPEPCCWVAKPYGILSCRASEGDGARATRRGTRAADAAET